MITYTVLTLNIDLCLISELLAGPEIKCDLHSSQQPQGMSVDCLILEHVYMHVYICTHAYTCIYTRVYTHTHTHTHFFPYSSGSSELQVRFNPEGSNDSIRTQSSFS